MTPTCSTPDASRWSTNRRKSCTACSIASLKLAGPKANIPAPLIGASAARRGPWNGIVYSSTSYPLPYSHGSAKTALLSRYGEAPKPWITHSVGRGPSSWYQCCAQAVPLARNLEYSSWSNGFAATYGLLNHSVEIFTPRARTDHGESGAECISTSPLGRGKVTDASPARASSR